MDNNQLSLPQFTLDQLSERVCKKLPVFTKIPTDKMWEGILDLCAEIEKEPRVVFSVIPKVKEQYKYSISEGSTTVQTYRTVFTRIYIILYYRHADKAGSEYDEVFSQLAQRMGIYAGDTLKNIIRPGIESALKFDKQVEQALKEKKKEVKPVFAYVDHSRPEMDRLFDEYSDESLFCSMSGIINELSERYGTHLDEANVWYNAKQVVRALGQLKRPDLFIDRAATSLVMGQMYKGYEGSQIILLCVYAMVRSAKDNVHFAKFIKAMEEYANEETFKHVVFKKHIGQIKKWIDENQPFDGYDYIGGTLTAGETFTRADVERILAEDNGKIENLTKENENLNNTIQALTAKSGEAEARGNEQQQDDAEETAEPPLEVLHNKVRFELFLRLLEKCDVDVPNTNKTEIGNLWHAFTEKSADDCRKYCSTRKYANNHTKKEIEELNKRLKLIGLTTIQL